VIVLGSEWPSNAAFGARNNGTSVTSSPHLSTLVGICIGELCH